MSELKKVFQEFIKLSYSSTSYKSFRDIKIDNYIICRQDSTGYSIIYLYNGAQFKFPWLWGDIFYSFNTYLGDRVNYLRREESDPIEKTIKLVTTLFIKLTNKLHGTRGQEILDILGELSLMSTKEFRTWCETELSLTLDPLVFISLKKEIEI